MEMRKRGKRGIWYAHCKYQGVYLGDSLETPDERIAIQRLAELKLKVGKGEYQKWKLRWDECEARYLETIKKKSESVYLRYESIIRVHLRPVFTGQKILDLLRYNPEKEKNPIQLYFEDKESLPESSLKKHARVLRDVIRYADPKFELPRIIYRNKGFFQTRFLKEEEMIEIVGYLPEKYQSFALVLAYTGLRLSDALRLSWKQVDLKAGFIETTQGKTGGSVRIPISGKLLDILRFKARVRNLTNARIFHFHLNSFQRSWNNASAKTKNAWARVHDLRHFFCSYLINRGVDHLTVAALTGHRSLQILKERYGHFDDSTLKKAMSVFDADADDSVDKPWTKTKSG